MPVQRTYSARAVGTNRGGEPADTLHTPCQCVVALRQANIPEVLTDSSEWGFEVAQMAEAYIGPIAAFRKVT